MESTDQLRRPIIVDTDLSFDDYVALLYLLQHSKIDVRAITVVNGVVHVKPGVENAHRLLALVGRPDIPIAGGPDRPLTGQHTFPACWRIMLDWGPRLFLSKVHPPLYEGSAPELIRQQCYASDGPVAFVALGPLTNLALALQADPVLAGRIGMIYVSSGAINVQGMIHNDVPGNPNRVAGWNLYVDAVAADLVFKAGIRIALIPKDITHVTGPQPLLFTREHIRRLRASARGQASRVMVRMIRLWQLATPQYTATPVWDAVTAAIVAEPDVALEWQALAIRIATYPDRIAGQTIVEDGKPTNVQACVKGDQLAFEATYMAIARGDNGTVTE